MLSILFFVKKAIKKFALLDNYTSMKLFYNLDNRLLEMEDYAAGNTDTFLKAYSVDKSALCFEISERHEGTRDCEEIMHMLEHYKRQEFNHAIDDFGVGFSGFKLLYEFTPDVIKGTSKDRPFLSCICKDPKKRIIVTNIIQLAKQLGVKIIAEGIERQSVLDVCIDTGCEFVQGYFIQKPSCRLSNKK